MGELSGSILASFEGEEHELIPILQKVQAELGYLPGSAMTEIARFTGVPESRVYGVASFYAQFYLERQGRHRIKVCRGTACHVRGSARIMSALGEKLGIACGETTPDYAFTLERVACFGSCALAPVVVVDDKVYGRMTPEKTVKLLDGLE
ncbi:MAG: NADH-quinone oxidoreductase subunit NuoE [Planctomycetota bacterium]|jgi:NADH-quinone oxidoreductase subunit E